MARVLLTILTITALATLGACSATGSRVELSFETLVKEAYSGIDESEQIVIKNQEDMNEVWGRHHAIRTPQPSLPEVDFELNQVIAVFLGTRSNGCYSITISSVAQTQDALEVTYHETTPTRDMGCTQSLVDPVHWVVVPRSDLPVVFYYSGHP